MQNSKYILIAFAIGVLVGGVIIWYVKTPPSPDTKTELQVVADTSKIEKKATIVSPVIKTKSESGRRTEKIIVSDPEIDLELELERSDSDSTDIEDSPFTINIKWLETKIKENINSKTVNNIPVNNYVQAPFFLNSWFYVSVVSWAVTILIIIFGG